MISTDAGHFTEKSYGRFFLLGTLTSLSSILACMLWGFKFGTINNDFHIIIVYKIAKGIGFPGDAMAATMVNYPSPFWYLVAYCSKIFPAPTVFLAFYLVSWVLLNVGVSSLIAALAMKKSRIIPWMFGSLVILAHGFTMELPLGWDPVIMPYLSQTFVSVGLCLLSFSLSVEKRYGWSAAVLGVAYNINAMQANFMLGILLFIWIFRFRTEGKKGAGLFFQSLLIFTILASPALLWGLSVVMEPPARDSLSGWALYDFAKFYFPFHSFLSVKALTQIVNGIAIPAIPLVITVSNKFLGGNRFHFAGEKEILLASILSFGYVIAGIFFSFCFPSRLVLSLHLFRSDAVFFPIVVSLLLAILINTGFDNKYLLTLFTATIVTFLCHDFDVSFAIIGSIVASKYIKERHPNQFKTMVRILSIFCICICIDFLLSGISKRIIFLVAILPVMFLTRDFRYAQLILILSLITYMAISFVNFKEYHDMLWKQRNDYSFEIERVARSASEIAPRDALFVIPPTHYIRSHLQRGVYLSMHDGGAYPWKKGFEVEFIRRLRVLGISYTPGYSWKRDRVTKEFTENIHSALLRLKTEGVTHAILPSSTIRNFPSSPILRSENFIVLDIDNAILATSPGL